MPLWLRSAVFILIFPGTLGGWLPWVIAGGRSAHSAAGGVMASVAASLVVAGWSVLLWCAVEFGRRGRGTPAPYDPPVALVVSGLYRFVRNPMYVGVVAAVIGQALWFRSADVALYAALLWLAFHLRVLLYEEPRLTQSFGGTYVQYCADVPRWIPRPRLVHNH
jgi:protein-S-isoprenylcysteine O-methyltransferase Ste14